MDLLGPPDAQCLALAYVKLVTMVTYTSVLKEISVMVCAKEVIAQKSRTVDGDDHTSF